MTDTRIEHEADVDERDEALQWLARRVRWERFLTSLHESSPSGDDSEDSDDVEQPARAA